jgi:hypothetical protein
MNKRALSNRLRLLWVLVCWPVPAFAQSTPPTLPPSAAEQPITPARPAPPATNSPPSAAAPANPPPPAAATPLPASPPSAAAPANPPPSAAPATPLPASPPTAAEAAPASPPANTEAPAGGSVFGSDEESDANAPPPSAAGAHGHHGKHKKKSKAEPEPQDHQEPSAAEPEAQNHEEPSAADAAGPALDQTIEGDAFGDETGGLNAGPLSFRVLLQPRYEHTFAEHSRNAAPHYGLGEDVLVHDGDGFSLQRFFFRVAADPTPLVGFKAILDFAKLKGSDVSNVLKQAYGTLRPIPKRLVIAAGIFKLPYSILELDPVARYELGSLGDADDFIKELGFAGRDVGAQIMVAPLAKPRWLRAWLGVYRSHAKDEHASPLGAIGARLESTPIKGLRVGIDWVGMPYSADYKNPFETSNKDVLPNPPDPFYVREQRWASGKAYSADVTYSRHKLTVRAEGMLGDRVDVETRYGARSFWAAWGLVAYRFKAGPVQLMPAARAEWLDVDREHAGGRRQELTLGLNVIFSRNARLLIDVTRTDVQKNTPVIEQPLPLASVPYLELDNTRIVTQLQLEI